MVDIDNKFVTLVEIPECSYGKFETIRDFVWTDPQFKKLVKVEGYSPKKQMARFWVKDRDFARIIVIPTEWGLVQLEKYVVD